MKTILIKPAPGRLVRDPDTQTPLNAAGEEKPFTPFWCRRLDDGDVLMVEKTTGTATEAETGDISDSVTEIATDGESGE
ncbi:TPA: DUF2635 domain-containing protein [Escherichia coli]|nr:DUF2635 domain-containing protein [Escherichia coli]